LTKKIEEKERSLRIGREKALQQTTQLSNKVKGNILMEFCNRNIFYLDLKAEAVRLKQVESNLFDEINFVDEQLICKLNCFE